MKTVKDVCRNLRSKAAGPFWVTIDLFFDGPENFARYSESEALSAASVAKLYGADPKLVKRFSVPGLNTVKISYPRTSSQGGVVERDMHCGQQYVRLLDIALD
ncbi:MAG TPA: DUF4387 domain-containing protein [Xanthomonadaceae bacterium]|nr:DUF4387 domain-containing protein [Xanthomonadaceae bacterium]